jgi:hypothetical protein
MTTYKVKGRALVHTDKGALIIKGDDVSSEVVARVKKDLDQLIAKGGVWNPPVYGIPERYEVRWEPFTSNTKTVTIATFPDKDMAHQAMVQLANTGLWYDLKVVPYVSK